MVNDVALNGGVTDVKRMLVRSCQTANPFTDLRLVTPIFWGPSGFQVAGKCIGFSINFQCILVGEIQKLTRRRQATTTLATR